MGLTSGKLGASSQCNRGGDSEKLHNAVVQKKWISYSGRSIKHKTLEVGHGPQRSMQLEYIIGISCGIAGLLITITALLILIRKYRYLLPFLSPCLSLALSFSHVYRD